jgi:hypothetical protein
MTQKLNKTMASCTQLMSIFRLIEANYETITEFIENMATVLNLTLKPHNPGDKYRQNIVGVPETSNSSWRVSSVDFYCAIDVCRTGGMDSLESTTVSYCRIYNNCK